MAVDKARQVLRSAMNVWAYWLFLCYCCAHSAGFYVLVPQHARMWAVAHVSHLAARPELTTSASSMALHWTIPNVFSYLAENGFLSSV